MLVVKSQESRTFIFSALQPVSPITSTPTTDQVFTDAGDNDATSSEENFPAASLDNEVWSEDLISDRQLCIHETPHKPNHQCSYPCPYKNTTFRLDLSQSTARDEALYYYKLMDLSDISSDLQDIMATTSDDDIPDPVDVSDSEHLDAVWFA